MEYRIASISGDGIGPEIVEEAKKVLNKVGELYGHRFHYEEVLMGGISIDTYGVPLTDEALKRPAPVMPYFWELLEAMWETHAGMMWRPICVPRLVCWPSAKD